MVIARDFKKQPDELNSIMLENQETSYAPIKKINVKSRKPVFYEKAVVRSKKGIIPERRNTP